MNPEKDGANRYMPAPAGVYETRAAGGVRWKTTTDAAAVPENIAAELVAMFNEERHAGIQEGEPGPRREDDEPDPQALHTRPMIRFYNTRSHSLAIIRHPWMSEPLMCLAEEVVFTNC